MGFTHVSMDKALADVASGRVSHACWSGGEGFHSTACLERGRVVTRLWRGHLQVDSFTMSSRETARYAQRVA